MSETLLARAIVFCILLAVCIYGIEQFRTGQDEASGPLAPYYDHWLKEIRLPPDHKISDAELSDFSAGAFQDLKVLDLNGQSSITDKGAASLAGLSKLKILNLNGTGISDSSIQYIAKLPSLAKLSLSGTKISGVTLNLLTNPNLRQLNLADAYVTDQGFEMLKDLTLLEEIDVSGTRVSPAAIENCRRERRLPYTVIKRGRGYYGDNDQALENRKLAQIDKPVEQRVAPDQVELRCIVTAQQDPDYMEGYRGGDDILTQSPNANGECAVVAEGVDIKVLSFHPAQTAIELRKQANPISFPCTKELKENLASYGQAAKCLVNSKSLRYRIGAFQAGTFAPCGCIYNQELTNADS